MLIPKKNRKTIYEHLFKEGVLVAKKDFFAPKHPEIETVPNLQVIKAMQVRWMGDLGFFLVRWALFGIGLCPQSLKSRGYVTERFSWQYYYWYLTNEGM